MRHVGPTSFCLVLLVQWVAHERELHQRGHVLELVKLLPVLDLVVRHVEHLDLLQHGYTLKLLDQAVRYPQLLQRLCHLLESGQALQIVPPKRQYFQVLC